MNPTASITELFSSLQGEGPHVGRHHLFVRFETCDANCAYCDTEASLVKSDTCQLHTAFGPNGFAPIPNPLTTAALGDAIAQLLQSATRCDAVVLTGGEPLMHADFIAHAAGEGRFGSAPLILETDGNLPGPLEKVIDVVAIVAADIKIPSATGEPARFEINERFLTLAAKKELYVKVVYGEQTDEQEINDVANLIARVRPTIPLILQPITPARQVAQAPTGGQTIRLYRAASAILPDVRVIPQTHRMIGLP